MVNLNNLLHVIGDKLNRLDNLLHVMGGKLNHLDTRTLYMMTDFQIKCRELHKRNIISICMSSVAIVMSVIALIL